MNESPHSIRLLGKWKQSPCPEGLCLERSFHQPSNTQESDCIRLHWELADDRLLKSVNLNGRVLSVEELPNGQYQSENIVASLEPFNRWQIILKEDGVADSAEATHFIPSLQSLWLRQAWLTIAPGRSE